MSSLLSLLSAAPKDPLVILAGEPHTGKSHMLQTWESDAPPATPSPIPLSLRVPAPTPNEPEAGADFEEISEVRSYLRLDVINMRMRARNEELLKKADVAIICVDVGRKGSLDAVLNRWIDEEIQPRHPKLPIILVLTHTDGNLSQFSLSMDVHVQPVALSIPALRIYTAPNLASRAQIDPIFEYAVYVARNPKQAMLEATQARESLGGPVEVVHLGPAGSACGMFLLGQVRGTAELRACARACSERMEDVVRRVYKVIGGSREVLEDIGAADLLPEGVAGDLILGIIPGAAAGDSAAAEMVRNRCRDEGITVEDFAARVVRALGRDGADRVGAGHVLGDSAHLPGTPRPERIAFGIRVSGNTKRSASRSSSGRYSNRGGSPRPPSSLGKAMAGPAMEFVYDEDPPRRSIDSAEQLSTVAGDHDHDESWTERSDETAGTGLGRAHEDMRIEYGKPPPFRMYVPSAVPIPRDQMSSEAPQPSTDYTLHGSPSQHSVALNHGSPPQHPLALNSSGSAPSTPRRIPSNSRTTPRSTQKGYDKGAFADRLDRLALDDALEGDSPVPSPGSTGYSSSFREVFGSGRGGR